MGNTAIRVENLGKLYRIGGKQERYYTLRDTLVDLAAAPFRKVRGLLRGESASGLHEEIWALKDVSFEVKHGEVVGIIGRNGAGKSTLLKILSRITEPTTGYADVYGRVGALLEVGTGFHPELTGRENVYLNGAILGMSRTEIDRKFDEIVDFAGVEKFIDTPVKHYSSGMGLRLGFAVAAHLEPEILVVDEVLAVGDAEFQKKCLGKMSEVAGEGRTVLFVSHNMAAVRNLCPHCIWLQGGTVREYSDTESAIKAYISQAMLYTAVDTVDLTLRTDRAGSGEARFSSVTVLNEAGEKVNSISMGSIASVEACYELRAELREPIFGVLIADQLGSTVLRGFSYESYKGPYLRLRASGKIRCTFKKLPLMHGRYVVHLWLANARNPVDYIENTICFDVSPTDIYNTGRVPSSNNSGVCYALHDWSID